MQQEAIGSGKHRVYLALGANIGERLKNLERALQELRTIMSIQTISSIYETEPVGYLEQPKFLNMVCMGETELTPQKLLHVIKNIEILLGRQPGIRNGPRPIDIDILFYDGLQIDEATLIIPHPRLKERSFVLAPLAEIAPNFVPPNTRETVTELLQKLPQEGLEKILFEGKNRDVRHSIAISEVQPERLNKTCFDVL
jgi:2-amino-4-hydroxy-6-hydroxymethyldihydropteridine diphosphokinase